PVLPSTRCGCGRDRFTFPTRRSSDLGASGDCENSGTIPGTVTANWDLCAGGTITVTYTGVDDCNNPLTQTATITVTPAPPAILTLPELPSTHDTSALQSCTSAPDAPHTNGASGDCENS